MGAEVFIAEVENRMGAKFQPIRPYEFTTRGDRIGWVQGEDKNGTSPLFIENGRITDAPGCPLKTGLREIAKIHKGDFRLTANQNLIVAGVAARNKAKLKNRPRTRPHQRQSEQTARKQHGLRRPAHLPAGHGRSRTLPAPFLNHVDEIMAENGLSEEHIVLRANGCPNGCGRTMLAEIGLVGKPWAATTSTPAATAKARASPLYKENITEPGNPRHPREWIAGWATGREPGEGFGDYAVRTGIVQPVLDPPRDFWKASAA